MTRIHQRPGDIDASRSIAGPTEPMPLRRRLAAAVVALSLGSTGLVLAGCDDSIDSAEDVGEEVDEAVDDAGDAIDETIDDIDDEMEEAGDELERRTDG